MANDQSQTTIKWLTFFKWENWRPVSLLTVVFVALVYGSICWPLSTLKWGIGIPVSLMSSVVLHELAHSSTAYVLGFWVQRLLVIGGGRRLWRSKNGSVVINSLIRRRVTIGADGINGTIDFELTLEGRIQVAEDSTQPRWKVFAIIAAAPTVNLAIGVLSYAGGFYPLTLMSAVMVGFSLLGGPGSDGHQMLSLLRNRPFNPRTGKYRVSFEQIVIGSP